MTGLEYRSFNPESISFHSADYYIFRITPLKRTTRQKDYVLYFPTEHLTTVTLCHLHNGALNPGPSVGNNHHNQTTPWGYPRFTVTGGDKQYFMVTSFKKGVYFPLEFTTASEFRRFEVKGNFGLGMFYGVAAIIFIVNAILFIFFRKSIFAYYAFFQIFIVISIASSDGLLTFFTDSPYLLNYADIPLHTGIFVSGFLFAKHFIKSREVFSKLQFIVMIAAIFSMASGFFYIQSGEFFFYLLAESISLAMLLSYWIIALSQFRKNENARLYVYAYSLYLFFAIEYYIIRQIGLPGVQLFSGQLKISCITEMIVLLVGMMSRVGMVLRENQYFRSKIEEHLEEANIRQKLDLEAVKIKYDLTDREAEVLKFMTQGMSNPEIAEKLFVSVNTVKYHIRNIFLKMEINSRGEAISMIKQI